MRCRLHEHWLAAGLATLLFLLALGLSLDRAPSISQDDDVGRRSPCLPPQLPIHFSRFQEAVGKPVKAERPVLGFETCFECHNSGTKGKITIGGIEVDLMKEKWVFYTEMPIWSEKDKHFQAYTVLLNQRTKEMARRLGANDLHRDQRCLACHTGFPLSQMPLADDGLVDRELEKKLNITFGVSCEGCHGPAGSFKSEKVDLQGWKNAHLEKPVPPYEKTKPWRFMSPKTKHDEFGFTDVRSPAGKAKLCVSCHIGDVEQGRVITHEMYAAGHPPLPGFELETFVEQMPRHWADLAEKSEQVQEMFLKHTHDPLYRESVYQRKSLHRTRALLTGSLVVAAEYIRLAGQLADPEVKSPIKRADWPEFASFDCFACHHELKSPAWRQARKAPPGFLGRPTLPDWPFILARIAARTLGYSPEEIEAETAPMLRAATTQPFGNSVEIAATAKIAHPWYHARALDVQKKAVTRAEGVALLTRIAAEATAQPALDYDSARQLVWAFQVIAADLKDEFPESAEIKESINMLSKEMILLDLRRGSKALAKVGGEAKARPIVEVDLATVLPFVARYDPAMFRLRFQQIGAKLR